MKKIENFMLPEHTNKLYTNEAISSIALTKEVADKINEIINSLNEFANDDLIWKQEIEGKNRKAILYMKDNLLNSLNDLMEQLRDSGFIDDRIEYHFSTIKNDVDLLDGRLDNLLGTIIEGSTTLDTELIDIRTDINGRKYTSAGESVREQLSMLPIGRNAIEQGHSLNMDTYTEAGNYVYTVYSGLENMPPLTSEDKPRYLYVECFGTKIPDLGNIQTWGKQTIYTDAGEKVFKRHFKWDYNTNDFVFGSWKYETDYNHFRIIEDGNLDNIVEVDKYIIATTNLANMPFSGRGALLEVKNHSYGWLIQEITGLIDFREKWYRIGNNTNNSVHTNNAEGLSITWSKWEKVITEDTIKNVLGSVDTSFSNKGYTIVNLGDSIIGNTQDNTSISSYLENTTGATVYNCSFGGCRMTEHNYHWNAFSMYLIANAIASGDWSYQEECANSSVYTDIPTYFANTVEILKNLDFSKVDIITIMYGTNDFTANKIISNSNKNDITTYSGALRYSIEKILTAYPNLRIVVVSPMYRNDIETNSNGDSLVEFVESCETVSKEYHTPFVNLYDNLGLNKFNSSQRLIDGVHPTELGRKEIAKLIGSTIKGM